MTVDWDEIGLSGLLSPEDAAAIEKSLVDTLFNMKCNTAIKEAVLAEREACAKLADEGLGWPGDAPSAARCIAANIRARGQK